MRNDVTQYVTLNERNARTTPMVYPMDMSPHQDKMVIQCYTYQPPKQRRVSFHIKRLKKNKRDTIN